jgi:hypothetical protein
MRAGQAQAPVRALYGDGLATQAFYRSLPDQGGSGLPARYSHQIHTCLNIQGGEDIADGWKGKGSTVHLVTEGKGLPLAFLVTAANVSAVTVGLKVVDQVGVPRSQGRARQRPASLAAGGDW